MKGKQKIFIVNSPEREMEIRDYFKLFKERFNYLKNIEIIFAKKEDYEKFNEDIIQINNHLGGGAEIIDERDLNYLNLVRILFSDKFFGINLDKQDEIFLHELGHYFTNPSLIEIRKFIYSENPKKLSYLNFSLNELCKLHNKGLSFIFQIPKLIQELNAEMWFYKKEKLIFERRLKDYFQNIDSFLEDIKNIELDENLFFELPRLNFDILFRKSILNEVDFNCTQEYQTKIDLVKDELLRKLKEIGFENFLLDEFDSVLDCLKHGQKNIIEIKILYKKIFEKYIKESSLKFSLKIREKILQKYNLLKKTKSPQFLRGIKK